MVIKVEGQKSSDGSSRHVVVPWAGLYLNTPISCAVYRLWCSSTVAKPMNVTSLTAYYPNHPKVCFAATFEK